MSAELLEPCLTCSEDPRHEEYPLNECPVSERQCGHHCNHSWINDHCHWCDGEYVEGEDGGVRFVIPPPYTHPGAQA